MTQLFHHMFLFFLFGIHRYACNFIRESPFFSTPIQNVTVLLGQTARMACVVEKLGHYKVAWVNQVTGAVLTVGDRVLTSNIRVRVERQQRNTWILVIENVTQNDGGQYMCQLSTTPPRKLFGFLFVVESPTIDWYSQKADVEEGGMANLECQTKGVPPPTVLWKREDKGEIRIRNSLFVPHYEGATLTLTDASPMTAGNYVCVAANGHPPSVSKVVEVEVQHSPIIQFLPEGIEEMLVRKGETISLPCRFAGVPFPHVLFQKDTLLGRRNMTFSEFDVKIAPQEFPYSHLMIYTIGRISMSDYGKYSCIATNELGQAVATVLIEEEVIPTTSTTTTITSYATEPQFIRVENHGPIPLRDISFTPSKENPTLLTLLQPTTSPTHKIKEAEKEKKKRQKGSGLSWTKNIARIDLLKPRNEGTKVHPSLNGHLLIAFYINLPFFMV